MNKDPATVITETIYNIDMIPVVTNLQFSKKLILEPLVEVHVVKQLIRCKTHCIVYCGQYNQSQSKNRVFLNILLVNYNSLALQIRQHILNIERRKLVALVEKPLQKQ